jgi:hypothetical protein
MDLCWPTESGERGMTVESTLCKELEVTRNIRLRRLQWVGHMLRMKDERVPKKALKGCIEWRS